MDGGAPPVSRTGVGARSRNLRAPRPARCRSRQPLPRDRCRRWCRGVGLADVSRQTARSSRPIWRPTSSRLRRLPIRRSRCYGTTSRATIFRPASTSCTRGGSSSGSPISRARFGGWRRRFVPAARSSSRSRTGSPSTKPPSRLPSAGRASCDAPTRGDYPDQL
jgi:hypothetical protein